jgi:4-aminobutyrate aminotransferase
MTDDLLARHRAALPAWQMLYYDEPIEIVAGSGRRVTDAAGRTYLDFFGGVLTTMLGYDIPEVREALERQIRTGVLHTSTLYLIRSQVELAEKIARLSGIPDARVFFTNSGSEANEAALLFATNYRRSSQILAVRNSYHGRTYATMGTTAPGPPRRSTRFRSASCTPATGYAACWPAWTTSSTWRRPSPTCARSW